nr:ribonuclease H-like domain-containing protein [Tanacetum cinerariifolium]
MISRSQSGIIKPIDHLSLPTSSISPIPKNLSHALKDPNWRNAMYDEYNALVKNDTWLLVSRPAGVNMVCSMWLFKHKFHADGTLSCYKARLVANDSSQQLGVYFDETFSLGIKPATIRTVLSLVVSCQWLIHQLDVKNLFERAYMVTCNPSRTPVDTKSKLGLKIYLYMHDLREPHLATLKRILRYFQGTLDLGLYLYASSTTFLVCYTDADWAGCPSTRSAEAEYQVVANVVTKTAWLRNLPRELHSPLSIATLVYCDNVSAIYMSVNPVQHQRTKHIEIDIHFVRDMVTLGQVRVLHVSSRFQYADIFTKGLPSVLFEEF